MDNITSEDLQKSLVGLIDEAIEEIEALKKSKFAAAEITLAGPGEKICDAPTNGKLETKKSDDEDEDDEDEESSEDEMEKAEDEDEESEEDEEAEEEAEKKVKKSIKATDLEMLKKSEDLMKSYVDGKFTDFEKKIDTLTQLVNKIADMPVAPKGVPAGVQVLAKTDEKKVEFLNKAEVANKLLELKKSGKAIETADIIRAETGSQYDVKAIMQKYNIN